MVVCLPVANNHVRSGSQVLHQVKFDLSFLVLSNNSFHRKVCALA
jgi:hypothetical protein